MKPCGGKCDPKRYGEEYHGEIGDPEFYMGVESDLYWPLVISIPRIGIDMTLAMSKRNYSEDEAREVGEMLYRVVRAFYVRTRVIPLDLMGDLEVVC